MQTRVISEKNKNIIQLGTQLLVLKPSYGLPYCIYLLSHTCTWVNLSEFLCLESLAFLCGLTTYSIPHYYIV